MTPIELSGSDRLPMPTLFDARYPGTSHCLVIIRLSDVPIDCPRCVYGTNIDDAWREVDDERTGRSFSLCGPKIAGMRQQHDTFMAAVRYADLLRQHEPIAPIAFRIGVIVPLKEVLIGECYEWIDEPDWHTNEPTIRWTMAQAAHNAGRPGCVPDGWRYGLVGQYDGGVDDVKRVRIIPRWDDPLREVTFLKTTGTRVVELLDRPRRGHSHQITWTEQPAYDLGGKRVTYADDQRDLVDQMTCASMDRELKLGTPAAITPAMRAAWSARLRELQLAARTEEMRTGSAPIRVDLEYEDWE